MLSIDETDKKIIELLRINATATNKAIAKELDFSETTIAKRIKRLTATGAMRVTMMWDIASLGLNYGAFVYLNIHGSSVKKIVASLKQIPEVTNISQMLGRSTIGAQVFTSTPADFLDVISEKIAPIKGVEITCSDAYLKILKYQPTRGALMDETPWIPAHIKEDQLEDIDTFDLALSDTIKMDARMATCDIASRLGVSETKVKYRLKKLHAAHAAEIKAVVDNQVYGYNMAAIVRLRVNAAELTKTAAALAKQDNIVFIALMSGSYNLFLAFLGSDFDTISEEIQRTLLNRKEIITYEIIPVMKNLHQCYSLTQLR